MSQAWDLLVARDELPKTELVKRAIPDLRDGETLLRVARVGMTANNVTYALTGESLNYWAFFPAEAPWGRVPLWGFADVVESKVAGVESGARIYGYLPASSHLVVRPDRVGDGGFTDASEHRVGLPRVYNRYALAAGDPSYAADQEDLQILYRPLFFTSFMLDDFLSDHDFFGAERLVTSSASSKTAYGTCFCIRRRKPHPSLIALTSATNVDFTHSLGCYDEVISYDDLECLSPGPNTAYIDVAGNQKLRMRVHEHFGEHLVYDAVVGSAHMQGLAEATQDITGPRPEFFFAPTQIQKRREDWGRGEIEKRYGRVWSEFTDAVADWVEVDERTGPEGLREAWLEAVAGQIRPRTGLVVAL